MSNCTGDTAKEYLRESEGWPGDPRNATTAALQSIAASLIELNETLKGQDLGKLYELKAVA